MPWLAVAIIARLNVVIKWFATGSEADCAYLKPFKFAVFCVFRGLREKPARVVSHRLFDHILTL